MLTTMATALNARLITTRGHGNSNNTNNRTTRDGIDIIDAVLIDDSKAETGELATVLVSVWGGEKVDLIEKNVGKPLAFFST